MGIQIKIHESQMGIQNGSHVGPSAKYRGPSEFVSSNDKMLAPALRDMAQGLGAVGDALYAKQQEKMELDLINDVQAHQAASQRFIDDYQMNYQGRDAIEAEGSYLAWNQQQAEALKKKYEGNTRAQKYLAQHAGAIGLSGINTMRDYGNRQMQVYKSQTLAGQHDRMLRDIAENPERWQEFADGYDSMEIAMNGKGRDPGFQSSLTAQNKEAALEQAVSAALREGTPEGLERAISVAQSGLGGTGGRSIDATAGGGSQVNGARFGLPLDNHFHITSPFGQRTAPKTPQGRGSSNHQGIDIRVPVGTPVRAISGGTVSFSGDKGGYGLAVVVKHDDGTSTMQVGHLSKLGVKSGDRVEAGQVVALSGNTGKSTGPHLDIKITENGEYIDPVPVLGLDVIKTKGVAVAKTTAGSKDAAGDDQNITADSAEAQLVPAGDTRSVTRNMGNNPALAAKLWGAIDAEEKRQAVARDEEVKAAANREVDRQYKEQKDMVAGLPFDEQVSMFRESIKDYPHETRKDMATRFEQDLSFLEKNQAASDQVAIGKYLEYAEGRGMTPSEKLAGVDSIEVLSPNGKDRLRKQLISGTVNKETPENRAALSDLRAAIDEHEIQTPEDLEAFAYENGMTTRQINLAHKYMREGGQEKALSQTTINNVYKELRPGAKKAPSDFYDLVLGQLKPGEYPSRDTLKKIVANLTMDGENSEKTGFGYGGNETFRNALKNERGESWLPDVSKEETVAISNALKQMGMSSPTDEEIRKFKKHEIMGIPYRGE